MLAYENGGEYEERGDARRGRGVVEPVERRPHQKDADDTEELRSYTESQQKVDSEISPRSGPAA